MALTSWKAFGFFDVAQVEVGGDEKSLLADQSNITCVATGSDNVFFGSADGTVRILSKAFKVIRSFKAHDAGSITHMKQVQGTSLLVTIAEDLSNEPALKVWALDKLEKKTGIPRCQCTLGIHNGRKQFPISAFAALDDLSQLAIGFGNGAVTVVRGDLIHDRGARQRTVFEGEEPITGIEFRQGNITTLYIATTGRISTLVISGRGQGQPARTLEDIGCGVGCMTIDRNTRDDVVVARDDGIYLYGLHGRGQVFAYECPKQTVGIFNDYVVLVSPPRTNSISKVVNAPLRALGLGQTDDALSTSTISILNTDLKFIAHQKPVPGQIRFLFQEWGDLFVLTLDGRIFRYHEKSFQQQLEILFQRNLYLHAITLAQKVGADASQQNIIYRKHGDYLYQQGDYDTAMQQYLRAIDNTEPSQVIRKFLDTHRIHNLIDYLEELHDHHRATSDHTTLLLNCYAKLKDIDKLEEFIKSPDDLKFDLDTAITMCRQGGYHDQAAYLARKHSEHDLVVDILIEDCKRYEEALAYIWRLEPEVSYRNLMKYATVLLEHSPADTTQLFISYYTGKFRPKKDAVVVQAKQPETEVGGFGRAASAVQNLAAMLPLPYMNATGSQPPQQNREAARMTQFVETESDEPPPKYDTPKPRSAFSAFVDHPQNLLTFLEACIESENLAEDDKADLYSALFEMYLHKANSTKDGQDRTVWENKAKALIESKRVSIDTSNVLLLSHLENFREGTILVREKQRLYFDIFRSYTTAKDTAGAIKALHKYGAEEPQLYPAALAYFTSSPKILEEAGDELDIVLKRIDEDGLMAPLQVIQTLSTNNVATMGMIKKYLHDTIERERQEISSNRRLIDSYRADTDKKRQDISRLSTQPETFNATRCSSCSAQLDLPTVHFLCKHSFHQRCLNTPDPSSTAAGTLSSSPALSTLRMGRVTSPDRGSGSFRSPDRLGFGQDIGAAVAAPLDPAALESLECPLCAQQNAIVREVRKAQEESAGRHELFLDALGRSRDKFGTISEWFGRGVMSASAATD